MAIRFRKNFTVYLFTEKNPKGCTNYTLTHPHDCFYYIFNFLYMHYADYFTCAPATVNAPLAFSMSN